MNKKHMQNLVKSTQISSWSSSACLSRPSALSRFVSTPPRWLWNCLQNVQDPLNNSKIIAKGLEHHHGTT